MDIEREARKLLRQFGFGQPAEEQIRQLAAAFRRVERETIERCAKAADDAACGACRAYGEFGSAIRALSPATETTPQGSGDER